MFWYKDTDPIKFLDKFEGQLSTHETENCLILSLLHRLGKNKQLFGLDSPRFWFSKESPTNIAIQTPPHNLILSYSFDLSRMDSFIDFLKAENIQIPGVIGEKTKVHQFAKKWAETNELKLNIEMNQRVYELRNVTSESLTHQYEIEFKTASIEHLDILLKWDMNLWRKPYLLKGNLIGSDLCWSKKLILLPLSLTLNSTFCSEIMFQ